MLKPLVFCGIVLCAACCAAADGGELETEPPIFEEFNLTCLDAAKPNKFAENQSKGVGKYNFTCVKEGGSMRVGLSIEGNASRKKRIGLAGSRAWCRDAKTLKNKKEFECAKKTTIKPRSFARDACTIWAQDDGVHWFSAKVEENENITCNISGVFGNFAYSFKASGATDEQSATVYVSIPPSESFLSPYGISPGFDAEFYSEEMDHPSSGPNRPAPSPSRDEGGRKKHDSQGSPKDTKPSSAPGSSEQRKELTENTRETNKASNGVKPPETLGLEGGDDKTIPAAGTSLGHANAATALPLPMLFFFSFFG